MYQMASANGVSALRYSSEMNFLPSPRYTARCNSASSGSGVKSTKVRTLVVLTVPSA